MNPSMPLGTAGLRELIRRPAGRRRRRSFYSYFDWLKPTKRTNGPNGRTDLSRIPPLPTAGPQDGRNWSFFTKTVRPEAYWSLVYATYPQPAVPAAGTTTNYSALRNRMLGPSGDMCLFALFSAVVVSFLRRSCASEMF